MSQRYLRSIAAAALLAGILSAVLAAAPNTLGYQGRLTQNGAPVNNTVAVTFKLYAVASGGTALWTESQTVTPSNGLYSAVLGQGVAFPAALFDQSLWLGVTVGSDSEMMPRQQLTSTPYTQQAKVATSATTASTASALSATPSACAAGQYARGISANGNAFGCTATSGSLPTCSNGQVLKYSGSSWSCGTDLDTNSGGTVTSITAGNGLTGGTITSSGTIAVDPASATLTANFAKQGGNTLGTALALGTNDNQAVEIKVNNIRVMRYVPDTSRPSIIGGSPINSVALGMYGVTVAGGGSPTSTCYEPSTDQYTRSCGNHATRDESTISGGVANAGHGSASTVAGGYSNTTSGSYSTVSGGRANTSSGNYSTVSGGNGNTSSGDDSTVSGGNGNTSNERYSTVSGGFGNTASGNSSTVSGGGVNSASGQNSTVVGGAYSTAVGAYSLAAGRRAKAFHAGAFVWADSTDADFSSLGINEFAVRAGGGARFEGGSAIALKGSTGDNIALYGINASTAAPSVEGWNQGTGAIIRGWSGAPGVHTLKLDLQNNGNLWIAGTLTQASDGRLKTDIAPLPGALDKLTRLRGVRYSMKDSRDASPHIGVIAQELEREYPELVTTNASGMKSVAYANLTAVLIEAVKTLKDENAELKSRMAAVEQTQRDELAALKRSLAELKEGMGERHALRLARWHGRACAKTATGNQDHANQEKSRAPRLAGMRLAAGMFICVASGAACAYEQLQGGFTSGGGSLASASYSGFGYLDQQPIANMTSGSYSLSAGFLTGELTLVSVPGAPAVLRLIPGNGTMRVLFTVPASNGGANISIYRATCTSASGTVMYQDGTASPITVTGLINNQSYSCSVTATNSAGTSVASNSFTDVVRPTNIVPILMLILGD